MASSTATRPPVNRKSRPLVVELVLSIDGTSYAVSPVAPAPAVGSRSFRLAKHAAGEACYDVAAFGDRIECTCPSYVKTHEGTSSLCKHGRALVTVGLLEAPANATAPVEVEVEPVAPAYADRVRHVTLPGLWKVVAVTPLSDTIRVRELAGDGSLIGRVMVWTTKEVAPLEAEAEAEPTAEPEAEVEVEPQPEPVEERSHTFPADADGTDWDDDHVWNLGGAGDTIDARTWDESLDACDDAPAWGLAGEVRWTTTEPEPIGPVARPLSDQLADRIALLRGEGSPLGDLMADCLEGLAGEVRATEATTVEQFRDRRGAMLASVA